MTHYITLDTGNNITAFADWQFPDSTESSKPVVRAWDGRLYFEGDPRIEKPQSAINAERAAEIKAALTEIDATSHRALRAILLDSQNGVEPSSADLAELAVCEARVLELRAELAAFEQSLSIITEE